MEENKTKVVNMNTGKSEEKKLTYEQLNDACNQLWQQNKQLAARTRELEQFAMNKRLDYLFKVLEYSSKFSCDFIVSCTNEIEEAMTITSNDDKKEE